MIRKHSIAVLACVLAAAPLAAQDDASRTSLEKGAWSLSFAVPGYQLGEQAELGVWKMVGARTNLGLTLLAGVNDRDTENMDDSETNESGHAVELGVKARRYLSDPNVVTPFLEGGVRGRLSSSDALAGDAEYSTDYNTAGLDLGVGAEWFPLRNVSISGQTGLRAMVTREERTIEDVEGETVITTSAIRTFTSILSLQIYF